jgi:hypothetical protein
MPNWCDNTVRFYNPSKGLIDMVEAELKKEEPKLFAHLRPRPIEEETNWYEWNIANWGSKWDADVFHYERNDDRTITVHFASAWAPPIALIESLVEQDWQVEALYHEPGCAFVGRHIGGVDYYYEYDITSRDSLTDVPTELIEWANLEDAFNDYEEFPFED